MSAHAWTSPTRPTPASPRSSRTGRGRSVHGVREALAAAVGAIHVSRPAAGASAGEQSVWLARNADALDLIANNEADEARAESVRADAEVARRLARGLGVAHAAQALEPEATADVEAVTDVDAAAMDAVPELAADLDVDELEVS